MVDVRFCILERTPRPGHWQHAPMYRLQQAEYDLDLNKRHYHERAIRIGPYRPDLGLSRVLVYRHDDAMKIMHYLETTTRSRGEYRLWGIVLPTDLPR